MKTILLIILFLLPRQVIAPHQPGVIIFDRGGIDPIEALWKAVCIVESSNNPKAINIKEGAYGIAQIRKCRMDHFVRLTGKNYRHEDAFNPNISREIFYYFATEDLERSAKAWNGSGWRTEIYWKKVKQRL